MKNLFNKGYYFKNYNIIPDSRVFSVTFSLNGPTPSFTWSVYAATRISYSVQNSRPLERKQIRKHIEGWAQDYSNSNIFLKPLFRGNLDSFVNNANLGAIAHTSNGT